MIDEKGLAEIVKAAWREVRGPLVGASDGQTYEVPTLTNDLMRDICRVAITAYLSASAEPVADKPVERREGFVTFYEMLDGQVAVLHPNFPPHIWDGGKMVAIAPPTNEAPNV